MESTEQAIQEVLNTFRDDGNEPDPEQFRVMLLEKGFAILPVSSAETLKSLARLINNIDGMGEVQAALENGQGLR